MKTNKKIEERKITFSVNGKDNQPEVWMEIKRGKFIWKGKEIKDVYKIYERFNKWLMEVEKHESRQEN